MEANNTTQNYLDQLKSNVDSTTKTRRTCRALELVSLIGGALGFGFYAAFNYIEGKCDKAVEVANAVINDVSTGVLTVNQNNKEP